jgi:hypothetical protein
VADPCRAENEPAAKPYTRRLVLTVEQRHALRERVPKLARQDENVVAGAAVARSQ